MTDRAQEILALGRRLRIAGFESEQRPSANEAPGDDPTKAAAPMNRGQQALALARDHKLSGHAAASHAAADTPNRQAVDQPTADDRGRAALELAGEVGLLGFDRPARRAETSEVTSRPETHFARPNSGGSRTCAQAGVAPVTTSPVRPVAATPAAKPLTKQPFAVVDIAAGSAAAFDALEAKMAMSFAASIGGQRSWLERSNADGSATRAYPATGRELGQLRALAGPIGSAGVRLSVASICRDDFAVRTTAGAPAAGTRPSVHYMDAGVPSALRQALGR